MSETPPSQLAASEAERGKLAGLALPSGQRVKPGVCYPWQEKSTQLPDITGDADMIRKVWEQVDSLGNMFIWQLLLSF
jgi:hypothetical protein